MSATEKTPPLLDQRQEEDNTQEEEEKRGCESCGSSHVRFECSNCTTYDLQQCRLCAVCYERFIEGDLELHHPRLHAFAAIVYATKADLIRDCNKKKSTTEKVDVRIFEGEYDLAMCNQLVELEREAFGAQAWGGDLLVRAASKPGHVLLVALDQQASEDNDEDLLQGYVLVGRQIIQSIAVRSEARGRGIGRTLMQTACKIGGGGRPVWLHVNTTNAKAYNLYLSLGFRVHHLERGYYEAYGDAFVMVNNNNNT